MSSEQESFIKGLRKSIFDLVAWTALYFVVSAAILTAIPTYFVELAKVIEDYSTYIVIGLSLFFGYMILKSFSEIIYWSMRLRYPHSTSAAVRSITRLLGMGALAAAIAGGAAGGAAGVALGGFIGMVIGFATQQVLGQAIAGLFVLIARPVKIGDRVTAAGETGTVQDISTLFTTIEKDDGTTALIPNNMLIGSKIYIHKKTS
ncbi:MAG: mechanosensitive ion channel family protein [Thermofilaceae archaeon]|nr:mechanosensitive ion channel family protein [Thermofilaceae archaeon]MCX8181261.1 mechanosensitive ion channel family protein [Thermofilaceae archaeon]MDW8003520.1 mechanosensitive ion channel [Thermofilaceae archaeon]